VILGADGMKAGLSSGIGLCRSRNMTDVTSLVIAGFAVTINLGRQTETYPI